MFCLSAVGREHTRSYNAEHSFFKLSLVRKKVGSEVYDVRSISSDVRQAHGRLGRSVNEAEIFHLNR